MSWQPPSAAALMDVVNATWPAAQEIQCGAFMLRDGQNGGKRASAASLAQPDFTEADIKQAAIKMRSLGQPALFIIGNGEDTLDDTLADMGYKSFDFVTLFAAPTALLARHDLNNMNAICAPIPLAVMEEIWAEGDIGPARIKVMQRVAGRKAFFLGRKNNTPAGAAFVAIAGGIAMVHALEVQKSFRRRGLGLQLMAASANWALAQNAKTFALVVLSKNIPACGLYTSLGMSKIGHYHYRIKDIS